MKSNGRYPYCTSYLVVKHDYKTKSTDVVSLFESLHMACRDLEETVFDYVIQFVGKDFVIHDTHNLNSRYWNSAPFSYNIMKHPEESLYKLSVLYKKKIPGVFYDSFKMEPLFYYEIVRIDDKFCHNPEDVSMEHLLINNNDVSLILPLMDEIKNYKRKENTQKKTSQ